MCPAVCKERNFYMNVLHKKALFVRKWLLMNAHYQSLSLTLNDAYDTAKYFAEKLDVHSMKRNWRSRWEFKIRVGKPKFRGSAGYTLLPHSLRFNSDNNEIRFGPELEEPKWYSNLVDTLMEGSPSDVLHVKRAYTDGYYSNHPHIATDGRPCLGGWASAWSQTIGVNNLVSLIPVSQSFLNTWTSNDAYWNINNIYRAFMHMPLWARKEMPLGKFIAKINIFKLLSSYQSNTPNIRFHDFTHWMRANESMLLQLVNDGIPFEKVFDCYYGNYLTQENRIETEDKEILRIKCASEYINGIFNDATTRVADTLLCGTEYANNLVAGTMMDIPDYYVKHPWNTPTSRIPAYEYSNIRERMIHYLHQTVGSSSYQLSNTKLHHILNFARKMNKGELFHNVIYRSSTDITESIVSYLNNLRSDDTFNRYLKIVNRISKLIGYPDDPLIWDGVHRNKMAKDFKGKMLFINDWISSTPEANRSIWENVSQHIAFETLDNYETVFTNKLIRRITRGKRINKPALHNINTADSGEQNQIPIGTF